MRFRAGQGSVQLLSGPGSYEAARPEGSKGGHGPPGGIVVVRVSDSYPVAAAQVVPAAGVNSLLAARIGGRRSAILYVRRWWWLWWCMY